MALNESYNDFDQLLEDALQSVESILKNDVAPALETKLAQSAKMNIHPRRNRDGSITDPSCIVSEITKGTDSVTLIVKDIAKPQKPIMGYFDKSKDVAAGGTMFANWIENELWMDIATYWATGDKVKRPARKFIEPVQLEAAMITKAALKSL